MFLQCALSLFSDQQNHSKLSINDFPVRFQYFSYSEEESFGSNVRLRSANYSATDHHFDYSSSQRLPISVANSGSSYLDSLNSTSYSCMSNSRDLRSTSFSLQAQVSVRLDDSANDLDQRKLDISN